LHRRRKKKREEKRDCPPFPLLKEQEKEGEKKRENIYPTKLTGEKKEGKELV